jgi:signal transduction histidine kinase
MVIGAELTAYRVVQESLTNAVKYPPGQPTLVRLAHTPDRTDVEVTNAGTAAFDPSAFLIPRYPRVAVAVPISAGCSGVRKCR